MRVSFRDTDVSVVSLGAEAMEQARRAEAAKQRTLTEAADLFDDPAMSLLVHRFYRHVAPDMVTGRSPDTIGRVVEAMMNFAHVRSVGSEKIRVTDMPMLTGTVVDICTDDMPFLVDSVSARLNLDGHSINVIVHPQLVVMRDSTGVLLDVLDLEPDDEEVPDEALIESWMHIEVARISNSDDKDACAESLGRVLHDVRCAVRDWGAMRHRAVEIAVELRDRPPASAPLAETLEAVELLEWLADDNFTFLGFREYSLVGDVGHEALAIVDGSGLGILSEQVGQSGSFAALPPAVRAKSREPNVLILTKANRKSTVHRPAYLDYIGIKSFDEQGNVIGERRFLGLWTAAVYTQSVEEIPVLRQKVDQVMEDSHFVAESHSAKDLRLFLETYPRDELFQISIPELREVASAVLQLQERKQTKLFLREDVYQRFMSCLIYLPRDRYTTKVRQRIEHLLMDALDGAAIDFTVRLSESVLARLHYVVHLYPGHETPTIDQASLERGLAEATRSWQDEFVVAALKDDNPVLASEFADAFDEAYKEDFDPTTGLADAKILKSVTAGGIAMQLYVPRELDSATHRFKIYRTGQPISLSSVLPVLSRLGVDVIDERPYDVNQRGYATSWIYDFGLRLPKSVPDLTGELRDRFESAFAATWSGQAEVDALNGLVTFAGMTWQQVVVLRSITRYLRQIGTPYGQDYIEQVLLANVDIARLLLEGFEAKFDPSIDGERDRLVSDIDMRIATALDDVSSLDHDRIIRAMHAVISAIVRTNYYQGTSDVLVFKINPRLIPDIPQPVPAKEMWVYSPRVEGVHLRFGRIARGGLRWSDRREDFRTEILGLVKAQEVKNAVIVPVGAKGGFFAKQLPDPNEDRAAWLAEGQAAYRLFINGMLDITDNRVEGDVVPPRDVVRWDDDDPYLVVAADKGTATFSDIANEIALEHDFWLGDAFASGGSEGYDHKAMGITARGAWISVQRHFRELGIDTQSDPISVVGIGDMSGDVFGNGMLRSESMRLIAAFDHRHIFIDPNPNPATSFLERARLYELPRSSWADYDESLISAGGGVFPRTAKSITLTPEIIEALAIEDAPTAITPQELIRSVLKAKVDLLWNGGIGTYVKGTSESNLDVGDKANDPIRINGSDLRCRVVGEGGNLGFTQLGRVEASLNGTKINTDAIDNSAGVDTSDHEVNIKILVDALIKQGKLTSSARHDLLMSMTDEIADLVLSDNYQQNIALGNARAGAGPLASVHQRMITDLESRELLNRSIEFLPTDEEFATRMTRNRGLTSPELCVLLAYSKIALMSDLRGSQLSEDAWFDRYLTDYFPEQIRESFAGALAQHPLREEIVETAVANRLINSGGITFVFRSVEETGASPVEVVRAAIVAIEVFDLERIWSRINELDGVVSTDMQSVLYLESRRLLDRATRWLLQARGGSIDVTVEVARLAPIVRPLLAGVPGSLLGAERDRWLMRTNQYETAGVPSELAQQTAALLDSFSLLDIADISTKYDADAGYVRDLYFAVSERFGVDRLLHRISELGRDDRWTALARQALRADLYAALAGLTSRILRSNEVGTPVERLAGWESSRPEGLSRAHATLDEIAARETADLATLSVALRAIRTLVRQGGSAD